MEHIKPRLDDKSPELDGRNLIETEITAACQRIAVDRVMIRKYYENKFNRSIFRDFKSGKIDQIIDWLRSVERPKPRVILTPHMQDAAIRTGLSARAMLHRVYKHFLITSLKDLTYDQKLEAIEWLSAMGRETVSASPHQSHPAVPEMKKEREISVSRPIPIQKSSGVLAATVHLELVVTMEKAQRILAIVGE